MVKKNNLPLPAVHGYSLQEGGGSTPLAPTMTRIQMPIRIQILFDADPDVDPDSDFLFDADPYADLDFYLMRIRIRLRIQVSQMCGSTTLVKKNNLYR